MGIPSQHRRPTTKTNTRRPKYQQAHRIAKRQATEQQRTLLGGAVFNPQIDCRLCRDKLLKRTNPDHIETHHGHKANCPNKPIQTTHRRVQKIIPGNSHNQKRADVAKFFQGQTNKRKMPPTSTPVSHNCPTPETNVTEETTTTETTTTETTLPPEKVHSSMMLYQHIVKLTKDGSDYHQRLSKKKSAFPTAASIANSTVKLRRSKAMDMRYFWVQDRVNQKHFWIYWDRGLQNLADYFSKHHPTSHHRVMRPIYHPAATR